MAALGVRNHHGDVLVASLWEYLLPFFRSFYGLFGSGCVIMGWEMFTDNVKHCFLCKESGLCADIYSTFIIQMQKEVKEKQFPSDVQQNNNNNVKLKAMVDDLANQSDCHSYSINRTVGLPKVRTNSLYSIQTSTHQCTF